MIDFAFAIPLNKNLTELYALSDEKRDTFMKTYDDSHVSPPRLESGKVWHGLSRNQGAAEKHDEQYQMSAGT
jgi:hypothetical protein